MTRSATRGQIKGLTAALRAIPLQAAFLCLKRATRPAEQGVGARGRSGGGRWTGPCERTGRTWPVCGYGSRGGGAGGPADRLRTFVAWLRMEAGQRGAGPCPQAGWRMRRRQPPLGRRLAGRGVGLSPLSTGHPQACTQNYAQGPKSAIKGFAEANMPSPCQKPLTNRVGGLSLNCYKKGVLPSLSTSYPQTGENSCFLQQLTRF